MSSEPLSAEELLPQLLELKSQVQALVDEERNFRKVNAQFNHNETTQLLLNVCERLLAERNLIEKETFEEHSTRLECLCRHFSTSLDAGIPEAAYRDQLAAAAARRPGRRLPLFGLCCQPRDFPPQQRWWNETVRQVGPAFQVLRGGRLTSAAAHQLLPGGGVYLRPGQRAAADSRVLICSEGTMVDASRVTARANDVRVCSKQVTAASAAESRNIVLKDSHLISGSLFCMVVRPPSSPFVPLPGDGVAQERPEEFVVDTTVPAGMTVNICQSLFKALCVKTHLVCKSFRALKRLTEVRAIIVLLTVELLSRGTVPKFCATMRRLGLSVVLVDCGCGRPVVEQLCQELSIQLLDFRVPIEERPAPSAVPGSCMNERGAGEGDATIDTSNFNGIINTVGPMFMHHISDTDQHRLRCLADSLSLSGPQQKVAMVTGISQELLFALCMMFHSTRQRVLFAVNGFHFPNCLGCLPSPEATFRAPQATRCSTSAADSTRCTSAAGMSPSSHTASAASSRISRGESNLESGGYMAEITENGGQEDVGPPHVLLSVNAIGVVSEKADCILLKTDLGCLGQALELLVKKLPH